jgi:hypothetical protein
VRGGNQEIEISRLVVSSSHNILYDSEKSVELNFISQTRGKRMIFFVGWLWNTQKSINDSMVLMMLYLKNAIQQREEIY